MSYPYGNPGGGFPPQQPYPGQPSYPPQPGFNYPPQQAPGYPPQQQQGYPPQGAPGGYPPQGAPGGYPPQGAPGGYPPQGAPGGYPPPQQGGYPPQQGGYPPAQPGYGNYPPAQGAPYYPPQQGGYQPQQQAAYQPTGAAPGGYQNQIPVMPTGSAPMQQGTIRPFPNFSAEDDAKMLRKAMKGFGTDEKAIIDVLAARSNSQRQEIKNRFKTMFGKDLLSDLKSELTGHFEGAVLALMMNPSEFDADQLRGAMKGAGTDESTVVEILCSRDNRQIHDIRTAYKQKYSRDLEKDLMNETSGNFRRLCVSLVQGNRVVGAPINMEKAKRNAQELYQAGEKMVGTDESTFNQILCSDSFEQLRMVFQEYHRLANRSIEQAVKSEMSGDLEKGFVSIIKCVESLPAFFASKLYRSMKGWGTKDENVVRIVISRCEVDMVQIKQEFQKQFGKTLDSMLEGDLSGDYKRLMMALVRG